MTTRLRIAWWLTAQQASTRSLFTLGAIGWAACVVLVLLERVADLPRASYHGLAGATFGLGLPVFGYLVLSQSLGGGNLNAALQPLARHGQHRRWLALGVFARTAVWTASFGALTGLTTVLLLSAQPQELLLRGITAGVFGGIAYSAYGLALSQFGRGQRARLLGLIADWLLGSSVGGLALPWPRRYVAQLLGGAGALEGDPAWGLVGLVAVAAAWLLLALSRTAP